MQARTAGAAVIMRIVSVSLALVGVPLGMGAFDVCFHLAGCCMAEGLLEAHPGDSVELPERPLLFVHDVGLQLFILLSMTEMGLNVGGNGGGRELKTAFGCWKDDSGEGGLRVQVCAASATESQNLLTLEGRGIADGS